MIASLNRNQGYYLHARGPELAQGVVHHPTSTSRYRGKGQVDAEARSIETTCATCFTSCAKRALTRSLGTRSIAEDCQAKEQASSRREHILIIYEIEAWSLAVGRELGGCWVGIGTSTRGDATMWEARLNGEINLGSGSTVPAQRALK